MKKFFLFRRSNPLGPVKRFSENGKDISILGISADQIAFMTAGKGEVNITFNGAGVYEDNELFVGDSIEKTNISVSCKEGSEMDLIEKIMFFVSRPDTKYIMKFDVLDNIQPFKDVITESVSNIKSKIKSQPTERVTQKISVGDPASRFRNIIAGINFGSRDNKPFLDYNHELLTGADDSTLTLWRNSGTGLSTYNLANHTGTVTVQTEATAADTGLSTACAQFSANSFLNVPDVTIKDDYTMYFVIGDAGAGSGGSGFGLLFGDDAGETLGFSTLGNPDIFTMRHDGLNGDPFKIDTSTRTSGTEPYQFPDRSPKTGVGERQFCYVFIIRRDKEFNLYLYNHEGELVGFVPAFTVTSKSKPQKEIEIDFKTRKKEKDTVKKQSKKKLNVTTGTPGRTDGNLLLQQLGTAGSDAVNSFAGTLGRFGVIKRDIGDASCSQLAQDLYDLYKPST